MTRLIILIAALLLPLVAQASIDTDLAEFYNAAGGSTNITPMGMYQSQAGGYLSGGSVFMRTPVRNLQLASFTPPHINAGCGGIDMFLGGFSFIDASQFTALLRNISSNATGFAFNLALKTFAPQVQGAIEELSDKLQKINNLNINSCEAAKMAVDGIAGELMSAEQKKCVDKAKADGRASDYADAMQYCTSATGRTISDAATPAEEKPVNINVVYRGLKKSNYFAGDSALLEAFMSFSGTLIVQMPANGQTPPTVEYLPPVLKFQDIRDGAAATGPNKQTYDCSQDTAECLITQENKKDFTLQGIKPMVQTALETLRDDLRLRPDNPPAGAHIGILVNSSIPALKIMAVAVGLGGNMPNLMINEMLDPLANDITASYLWEGQRLMQERAVNAAYKASVPSSMMQQIQTHLSEQLAAIEKEADSSKQQAAILNLIERAQNMEKLLMAQLVPSMRAAITFEGV